MTSTSTQCQQSAVCDCCLADLAPGNTGVCQSCQGDGTTKGPALVFARFEAMPKGELLVVGDTGALRDYIAKMFVKVKDHARGVVLRKSDTRLRAYIPLAIQPLSPGSRLEFYEGSCVGVKGDFPGEYMGITETLDKLEAFFTHDHGPAEFARVFGKQANPAHVAVYNEQQAEIAARKAANQQEADARRVSEAMRTHNLQLLTPAELADFKAMSAEQSRLQEIATEAKWLATVGTGKVANPRYQAFLDTVEDVQALALLKSNHPFFAFIDARIAEFVRTHGHAPGLDRTEWDAGFTEHCRKWAEDRLSNRVRQERADAARN